MMNHSWIRRALAASFVSLAALVAVSGDAHAATPAGSGNFRRAEVVKAANANPARAYVMGLSTANKHSFPASLPAKSRIMAVSHNGQVNLVKAPIDKSKPVTRLTAAQAHSYGLITQAQAQRQASHNSGTYGTRKATMAKAGIAPYGYSYKFTQSQPRNFKLKGTNQIVTHLERSVPMTGGVGETASARTRTQR